MHWKTLSEKEKRLAIAGLCLAPAWCVLVALFFVCDHVPLPPPSRRVVKGFPGLAKVPRFTRTHPPTRTHILSVVLMGPLFLSRTRLFRWVVASFHFVAAVLIGPKKQIVSPLLAGLCFTVYGLADVAIDSQFVVGVSMFAIGHALYCLSALTWARFAPRQPRSILAPTPLRLAGIIAAIGISQIVAITMAYFVSLGVETSASSESDGHRAPNPKMAALVWFYLSFFTAIAACSVAWWPRWTPALSLFGTAFYLSSDVLVVLREFVCNPHMPGAVMATYYCACLINALAPSIASFITLRQLNKDRAALSSAKSVQME